MRGKIIIETTLTVVIIIELCLLLFYGGSDFSKIYACISIILLIIALIICIKYYNSLHYKIYKNIKNKYSECFEQKNILNKREQKLYKLLYKILHDEYGDRFIIFSQVRMRDIIDIKEDLSWAKKRLVKPHYGSVDFLIVDFEKNFKPMIAIELNGGEGTAHEHEDQIEQDQKKKDLFNMSDIQYRMFENGDEKREKFVTDTILGIMEELLKDC